MRPVCLVVSLWIKDDDVAGFEAFERAAAEIMATHGGRIEHVVRRSEPGEGPFEVHIVTFPSEAALGEYRADARFKELWRLRDRVIARTEIWRGERRPTYSTE
jgi:uncharacterized protein (DUF1330 family)